MLLIVFLLPAILEASKMQGTVGKYLLGIMVVNSDNSKMGLMKALGRNFLRTISYIFFGLGHLLAAAPPNKQAFHDIVFKTKVIKYKEVSPLRIAVLVITSLAIMILAGSFKGEDKGETDIEDFNKSLAELKKSLNKLDKANIELSKTSADLTKSLTIESPTTSPLSPAPSPSATKKDITELSEFERRRLQSKILREGGIAK